MSGKAGIQKIYPLSPMQQGMLFHALLDPRSTAYFEQIALTMQGELNERHFEESLNRVMQHHEALRTVFLYEKVQKPLQVVMKSRRAAVRFEDLSRLSEEEQEAAIGRFREEDKAAGFDLSADVLLRAAVFRTAPERFATVWSFHHILMDGWCLGIVLKDFMAVYAALQNDAEPVLGTAYPYSAFIEWLQRRDQEEAGDYWRSYLEGYGQRTPLPSDVRPVRPGFVHEELAFTIDAGVSRRLEQLAQQHQTTLNTIVQAVWAVLLGQYNGVRDVAFGAVVSGRPSEIPHVEQIVGLFINSIPVRVKWDGDTRFTGLLRETQLRALDSARHDYFSLADIQAAGGWKDGLIDHLVVFENYPIAKQLNESGGREDRKALTIEQADFVEHTNYDFTMLLSAGDGLNVKFSYNALAYGKESMERIAGHLASAIRQIAENPDMRVADIVLPTEEESQRLQAFNRTEAAYPKDRTLHALFEEQARRTPERTAVLFGERTLTYAELNGRADRLAGALRRRGAGADRIVAVMAERSPEMMAGLFAVLKAGGAYLPIDPGYPEDRIRYMLEDSGAALLLTTAEFEERVPASFGGERLLLGDESLYAEDRPDREEEAGALPYHLAYVIYTSGSTGRPKGVMIEHGSAVNRIHWMQKAYPLGAEDVILQKTPFTFDVSVWELFWWAMAGASVCLLEPGGEKDPSIITETIRRRRITTMHFVPSMMHAFLEHAEQHGTLTELRSLRHVFASGEALPLSQVEQFNRLLYAANGTELVNLYGPTEATVDVSCFPCSPGEGLERVPIGKPIDNIRLYVLDEELRLLPLGAAGELCIAGAGVARGYLNKPELTAEKFVANPFEAGGVMYKTGDLARWLPDGNVEYLGRIDHQVKIRGYRIELGEIENALLRHERIGEAAVTARKGSGDQAELCAYLVSDEPPAVTELRAHLGELLPEYMIPASFTFLERMPLTASGKLDRKALPEPELPSATGAPYAEPTTETERKLAGLWKELLGAERCGIHDSFFELGGHSLKAISLVSRIHKEFDKSIPLRAVFEHPTIAAMARLLDGGDREGFLPIPRADAAEHYPLSPAQKRMFVMSSLDPADTSYNMPGIWEIEGPVDADRLNGALRAIVARHESLRTSFAFAGEEPVQRVWREAPFELARSSIDEAGAGERIRSWVRPFDLTSAPLLRAELCSVGDRRHVLLVDMHHIVSDGVSQSLFFGELAALYRGETLPEPSVQYKDYAVWQRERMKGEPFRQSADYWLGQYADGAPVLQLPEDGHRAMGHAAAGARHDFGLDAALSESVRRLAAETGTTPYMVLLSAYFILLSKYSGQEDFVIGTSTAGRAHPDVQPLIGMFVGTLALRGRPKRNAAYRDWLEEVRTFTLSAFEHEAYPFEELVGRLGLDREVSRHPLFDTFFVLQNMDFDAALPEDMPWRPVVPASRMAKFALTLEGMEQEGRFHFGFEYRTARFREETVRRMAEHYVRIVEQIAARPELELRSIHLLSQEEELQQLQTFNRTEAAYPKDRTLHALFEEQARRTPERTAVLFGERTLTYAELNGRADRLAGALRRRGAGPDRIVAVMAERSPEMMAGLFAVLKAGGAYLPIDPGYPEDRIRYMLEDSGAALLLTTAEFEERVPASFGGERLLLGDESLYAEDGPDREEHAGALPHHLAYVIYTSGSTGRPKGVMIEHESVVSRIHWMQKAYPIGAEDVILQKTPFTFDVSVWELFWWAMAGAAVYLLEPGGEKDPAVIAETIRRRRITTMHFVPSMMHAFLEHAEQRGTLTELRSLRHVFASGEALPLSQVEQFNRLLYAANGTELVNLYGPTEATVDVSCFPCSPGEGLERVPIGKPIDNIRLYVLDEELRLLPLGAAGELCIAGAGVARGYLNKPELTAEKFVANPFEAGGVMYKTGDLARWLPDGNVEYLGRIDHQVKIRGYRIELGEIENALLRHERIGEAAVTARKGSGDRAELCAYLVSDEPPAVTELRAHLGELLPEYMIPASFTFLERMPLTASGKLDRKALPEPVAAASPGAVYEPPRNAAEEALVKAWQEVLGRGPIGIHDHFFELGGDSIKAIQVSSRLHREGYRLDLKTMFRFPVLSDISSSMKSSAADAEQEEVVGEVPLSPIQKWFFGRGLADAHHWNQAVMLHAPGGLRPEAAKRALAALAAHHDALRIVFSAEAESEEPKAWNRDAAGRPDTVFAFETFDLTEAVRWEELVREQANRLQGGLHLSEGPLCRAALFHTPNGDHLLIVIHHLLVDGVSWRILLEDLSLALAQQEKGEPIRLPAKSTSYKAWSEKLRAYAASPKLRKESAYWRSAGQTAHDPLPSGSEASDATAGDRGVLAVKLSPEDTRRLLRDTRRAYNTETRDLLLTALGRGLRAWAGMSRIAVDLEGHGREDIGGTADTTRTVGWFTTIFPVVLDIAGTDRIGEHIKRVKETLRRIPNKGIGYGVLKYLGERESEEDAAFRLQPEILFNYLGDLGGEDDLGGLRLSPLPTGDNVSPRGACSHRLEINGMLLGEELGLYVHYNRREFGPDETGRLAECLHAELRAVIAHCAELPEAEETPSDAGCGMLSFEQYDALRGFVRRHYPDARIEKAYPLSPAQSGILFHALLDPQSPAYAEQMTLDFRGRLDADLFRRAFEQVIQRHEMLRTLYVHEGVPSPLQVVLDRRRLSLEVRDLTGLSPEEQAARIRDAEAAGKELGFDLPRGDLLRIVVLVTGGDSFQAVWTYHHILMDGWCLNIVMKEFLAAYEALTSGETLALEPPASYERYLEWLEERPEESSKDYWQSALSGYEPPHAMLKWLQKAAPDREAPYALAHEELSLGEELTRGLERLASERHATVSSVMQALWGILLSKYNRVRDVAFGSIVSGRPAAVEGVEQMVGLFINTVPVRVSWDAGETFAGLLESVQSAALETVEHDYLGLPDIQALSPLKQSLIDHIMVFENYPLDRVAEEAAPAEGRLGIAGVRTFEQTNYDLNVMLIPGKELLIRFAFNSRVIEPERLRAALGHLRELARQAADRPDRPVAAMSMITEAEKERVLGFNPERTDYPKDRTLSELFEEQARLSGERIALVHGDRSWSYKELLAEADRLAQALRQRGLRNGQTAGIMADRSAETVIGMLAVIRTGGAYLPLDPAYPAERLRFMASDGAAGLVIAKPEHARMADFADNVVLFGEGSPAGETPAAIRRPEDTAYVMYTSGSTGQPKGVMVTDRNVVRLVKNADYADFRPEDRILMTGAPAFDATTFEVWGALLNGLQLHVADEEILLDAERLADALPAGGITTMWLTSPLFNQLSMLNPRMFAPVRRLIVGGDALSPVHIRRVREACPRTTIINGYGPTENTTFTTTFPIDRDYDNVPIGKPISHSAVYLLDESGQPVPVGIPGELCAGGDGIAKGYVNLPELTAERFVPDPFEPQGVMYRTGDLARWLPDGNIEYLGRMDRQVKIRGFRVETGEVASALLNHPAVADAAVVALEDAAGEKRLCAYYVASEPVSTDELKAFAGERLPDYMIPASWTRMDRLPLNRNGKLDHEALPEPIFAALEDRPYAPPRSAEEHMLARIWAEVLGYARVGIHDNYFELGGDSIKAIQVSSRLHQSGWKLSLKTLFRHPTIAALAPRLEKTSIAFPQEPVEGEVPLTPIQHWFFEGRRPNPGFFNQSMMLHRRSGFDTGAVRSALAALLKHHDALRMIYRLEAGSVSQWNRGGFSDADDERFCRFREFDFRPAGSMGELTARLVQAGGELQASLDPERGPLVAAGLFRTNEGDHLLIAAHHLVVDGVSWRILLEDFSVAYGQAASGVEIRLPDKTTSFRSWALQLREYASSRALLSEIPYWRKVGEAPTGRLATDGFASCRLVKEMQEYALELTAEESESVTKDAHRAYHTEINDVLLTALGLSLRELTDGPAVAVELEGHGREELFGGADVARTVGWFTSMYPVVLDFGDERVDLGSRLKATKEMLRRVPRKGVGYGLLKYLSPAELCQGIAFGLQPDIAFNYLGEFGGPGDDGDLSLSAYSAYGGPQVDPEGEHPHRLTINGFMADGRMRFSFAYHEAEYRTETIERLALGFREHLLALADYCRSRTEPEKTPSDLGWPELAPDELKAWRSDLASAAPGAEIVKLYPLSPLQEGLLFHALYDPSSPAYFEQTRMAFEGQLDVGLFEESFNLLVERHDVLRTVFRRGQGTRPLQAVLDRRRLKVHYEDLRGLRPEERQRRLEAYRSEDREAKFDLSRDILMRFAVLQTEDRLFEIIWSYHHILMDGWCLGILMKEFGRLYEGLAKKDESLPRLPEAQPYGEFIAWHERQDKEEAGAFWERYLSGYEQLAVVPALEADKEAEPASAEPGAYGTHEFAVPARTAELLEAAAKRYRTTVSTVLQAAWSILLAKYNHATDVAFGTVVSGRPADIAGVETMVGLFINTIPVRVAIDPAGTFAELLQDMQRRALDAAAYDWYPLAEMKSAWRSVPFQHLFVYENYPVERRVSGAGGQDESSLTLREVELFEQTNYDFTLVAMPGEELRIKLSYNASVYGPAGMERIRRHLLRVLEGALAEPEGRLDAIAMLEDEEREAALAFNATEAAYPREETLDGLFAAQAAKAPERAAMVAGGETLTYGELAAEAARYAAALAAQGVKRGDRVGLIVRRGFAMAIGMLAILKSGAAYVPIEPDYPAERQRSLLDHAEAAAVLTDAEPAFEAGERPVLRLDLEPAASGGTIGATEGAAESVVASAAVSAERVGAAESAAASAETIGAMESAETHGAAESAAAGSAACAETSVAAAWRNPERSSSDLAYIIYTSGSTGTPKGVMMEHRPAVNLIHWVNGTYGVGETDRLLWVTSMCFDLSVYDLFGLWAAGGTVVTAEKEQVQDPRRLWRLLEEEGITFWDSVPTTLNYFVQSLEEQAWSGRQSMLRLAFLSGDWIPVGLKDRLRRYFPEVRVIGLGGATEAAVWSNYYPIERVEEGQRSIPYGKPLANNEFYILDPFGEPVPAGAAGELHIGGAGVARGYLNDELRTKEAFVASPFRPGERMYRTGDLGRLLPDGNMEFLGRKDHQVKIRGYRIELGEVESRLAEHPEVREAVAIARGTGDPQLCAYVVAEPGSEVTAEELKTHLAKKLPSYMLPSYIAKLEELPLSANGKIDRKALPAPEGLLERGEKEAPRTETERALAAIWRELLGVGEVGRNEDFFALGGHSLLAATMAARTASELGVELPLPLAFRYPTIRELAEKLEALRLFRGEPERPVTRLNDGGEGSRILFCFPPVAGYGHSYKGLADALPGYTWDAFDFVPAEDPVSGYVRWIKELQPQGPYLLFGYSAGGNLAFEVAKALEAEGETVTDLILLDAMRKMEPARLPLHELELETERLLQVLEDSEYREFLKVPYIRKEAAARITGYRIYLNELANLGTVRARVHMIASDDTADAGLWSAAAEGEARFYQGAGPHTDMLVDPHFGENVRLLRAVLEPESAAQPMNP